MSKLTGLLSAVLAVFLLATALMKIISGYPAAAAVSSTVYYVAVAVEIVLGVTVILERLRRLALVGIVILAVVGIVMGLFSNSATCGCLGADVGLSPRMHVMLAGTLGAVSVIALLAGRIVGERLASSTPDP